MPLFFAVVRTFEDDSPQVIRISQQDLKKYHKPNPSPEELDEIADSLIKRDEVLCTLKFPGDGDETPLVLPFQQLMRFHVHEDDDDDPRESFSDVLCDVLTRMFKLGQRHPRKKRTV